MAWTSAERDVRVRLRQVHDLSRTSESVDEASRFGDAEICNGRLPDEVKELLWDQAFSLHSTRSQSSSGPGPAPDSVHTRSSSPTRNPTHSTQPGPLEDCERVECRLNA
jgi:hypothetical protein